MSARAAFKAQYNSWWTGSDSQFALITRNRQAFERPGGNRRNPVAREVSKRTCTPRGQTHDSLS